MWDPLPIIAWNLWVYRGDKRILEETYAAIVKDIAYQDSEADEDGLVARGIGDWCPVDKAHAASNRFASSCYYYLAQTLAARIADVLERNADARRFATGAERTRQGILRRLFDRDALRFDNGFQTAQSMAVSLGVVDAATARTLASRLADALAADGFRFDAGTLGSRHLFRALSAFGWDDAALKTLLKETGHSFADWIRRGSTTLWEDFDDGRSRNHIMYGDFSAWAYEYLAGIRPGGEVPAIAEAEEPGFKTFLLAPHVPASLDFVTAETRTPYGVVKSAWRREGAGVRYSFVIPPNTTARIVLPEGDEGVRGSGEWVWVKGGAGK